MMRQKAHSYLIKFFISGLFVILIFMVDMFTLSPCLVSAATINEVSTLTSELERFRAMIYLLFGLNFVMIILFITSVMINLILSRRNKQLRTYFEQNLVSLYEEQDRISDSLKRMSADKSNTGTKNVNDVVTKLVQEKSDLLEVIKDLKSGLKSPSGNRSMVASPAGSWSGEINSEKFIQRLINDYNNAIQNSQYEQVFIENYKPVRIGVANAMDIKKGVDAEYKWVSQPQGDYLAIDFSKYAFVPNAYLVIPKFKIIYQDSYHVTGGMGVVFQSDGYEPQKYFDTMTLLKPAKFTLSNGNNWRLLEQGRLRLGKPESESFTLESDRQAALTKVKDQLQSIIEMGSGKHLGQLIMEYNLALQNESNERIFYDLYRPIRLGFVNVVDVKQGKATEYRFERLPHGDYYAIDLSKYITGALLVVPRFKLTYQDSYHLSGGMGLVFQCDGYKSQKYYHGMVLLKPAQFIVANANDWKLVEKGHLRLEKPE